MKIGIIGAGVAGLSSLKNCIEDGYECVVLERNDHIGGVWHYEEKTGTDEHGIPVHSSMYEHLRTNAPKELTILDGFPYPEDMKYSYLRHDEILSYIHSYADAYNLWPNIKLSRYVTKVSPLPDERWSVKYKCLDTKVEEEDEFDVVLVCNGHYSVPFVPEFVGLENFKGTVIHSHDYRKTSPFKNKIVLVIGAAFSGIDIATALAAVSESVLLSHRNPIKLKLQVMDNMLLKPEVKKFGSQTVMFKDGTEYGIDAVILCTGYVYSFPFLSSECGITIENCNISPLYKHIINVEHPTMAFIGIPTVIPVFPFTSLQVKFYLAYLQGKFEISKEDMVEDIEKYNQECKARGQTRHHDFRKYHRTYVEDLAVTANIRGLPPVISKMHDYVLNEKFQVYSLAYRIINDKEFECYECPC